MKIIKWKSNEFLKPKKQVIELVKQSEPITPSTVSIPDILEPLSETAETIKAESVKGVSNLSSDKNSNALLWALAIGGTATILTAWYLHQSGYFRARKPISRLKINPNNDNRIP